MRDEDIIEELYAGALAPAGLKAALARAVTRAGASGGNIHVVDKASLSSLTYVTSGARYSGDAVEDYFRHWRHINVHRAAMRRTAGVFLCHEQLADETLARAPYAQDFYFRMGERWLAGAVASSDPRYEVSLVFNRSQDQARFDADVKRLIGDLLPHVRRAAALAADGAVQGRLERGIGEALGASERPVWLVDATLRIQWSNRAAEAMMRQDGLFAGRGGRLALSDTGDDSRLAALVRSAANRKLEGASAKSLLLQGEAGALELEIMPATVPDAALRGAQALAMVMGRAIGLKSDADKILRETIGLTATEARLAVEVARGAELEEISAARGISNETVRTQLRSVYLKSGTSRQAGLAALVWGLGG